MSWLKCGCIISNNDRIMCKKHAEEFRKMWEEKEVKRWEEE